jgi:SOS-response transcriptional repressor LexA
LSLHPKPPTQNSKLETEMTTSWNSELPSGRNPFWIKDESMAKLGLHSGDAVSIDTSRQPVDGDLVLVEIETDETSDRLVRQYFAEDGDDHVRLVAASPESADLELSPDQMMVLGVVCTKVRFEAASGDSVRVIEEEINA